jgi:hypothetical protein
MRGEFGAVSWRMSISGGMIWWRRCSWRQGCEDKSVSPGKALPRIVSTTGGGLDREFARDRLVQVPLLAHSVEKLAISVASSVFDLLGQSNPLWELGLVL